MPIYGYGRGSTKKQENSPHEQRRTINSFVDRHEIGEADDVVHFVDVASARKKNFADRDAGKALLGRLKDGDTVIVTRLDRMFRNTRDLLATVEMFNRIGVSLRIIDFMGGGPLDTKSMYGELFVTILGAINTFEARLTSERIKEGLRDRKAREVRHTGYAGYGFRWVKKTVEGKVEKVRVEDKDERDVMRKIAKWRLQDPPQSWEEIDAHLRKHKVLTKHGKSWNVARIRRACQAEFALQAKEAGRC